MNNFKPMLAFSDQVDLTKIQYPMLASYKLDGIRCVFIDGKMLSRSLKPIPSKQLQDKFEPLKEYSLKHKIILDGELYCHGMSFQDITSAVMTKDGVDTRWNELKFHCFDAINNYIEILHVPIFEERWENLFNVCINFPYLATYVNQTRVRCPEDVEQFFEQALEEGYEGLILKNPNSLYKFGRTTFKEQSMFKVKPYRDWETQIVDVIQSTVAREGSEKKINELGYSRTSNKKDDRVLIEKASAFLVKYGEHDLKVTIAATDEEKEKMWREREGLKGRWISYKGMMIGAKDVPRHPVFLRFRDDI